MIEKIQNIQALRGIAALLVVLFHLVIIEQKYGGAKPILPNLFQFGMFGVDMFFVISGFLMVAVTRGKFRNQKNALQFLYHRASRIYPTYWVYTLLVLIVFLIRPAWVNSSQGNQIDILASFLLLPSETLPLVMVGWTLIHEMYFYLFFFMVLLLISERYMPATLLFWGIVVLLSSVYLKSNDPAIRIVTHPLTVEFIGGCFLAIIYYAKKHRIKWRPLLMLAGVVLVASLFIYTRYQNITGQAEPLDWWRILIFGLPALMIVYCLVNAEADGFVAPSALIKVGNASYSIYLSHILTLSAAGRVWGMFANDSPYDNFIMLPVLLILVVAAGMASYHLIEKPLLGLSRKFM